MTLGFPTIIIPATKGGDGREADSEFSLSDDQISWISTDNAFTVPAVSGLNIHLNCRFHQLIIRAIGMLFIGRTD